MAEPEIALVFTPEPWVEELHRHLTDHGGARVRQVVVEPEVALEEQYDVLIASHRWPALTRAFVEDIHDRGRQVLAVHERDEPAAGQTGTLAAPQLLERLRSTERHEPIVGGDGPLRQQLAQLWQRGDVRHRGVVGQASRPAERVPTALER